MPEVVDSFAISYDYIRFLRELFGDKPSLALKPEGFEMRLTGLKNWEIVIRRRVIEQPRVENSLIVRDVILAAGRVAKVEPPEIWVSTHPHTPYMISFHPLELKTLDLLKAITYLSPQVLRGVDSTAQCGGHKLTREQIEAFLRSWAEKSKK